MTDEEIEEIVSKDFRQQSIILWAMALATMLILNTIILISVNDLQEKDCPDCELICPDVIDYGEDYEDLLVEMYQAFNRSEYRLTIVYNAVLDDNLDWTYPYDDIKFSFMNPNNTTFMFHFYNNHLDQGDFSLIFSIDNWTEIFDWVRAKHPDTFTQYQKNFILLIATNMAYYKETGTWLGE